MDALELLKTDHKKVKDLFKAIDASKNEKQRKQLFAQVKTELETHTHIEETVFYPTIAKNDDLREMVLESLEEHKQVKTLLGEMENIGADSETFEPKFKVLKENVEHHAVEEEEEKMFPKIRKSMDPAALNRLGQDLEMAKSNVKAN
jgi:iron-sulfur cluster repair protein YtfE (RIC family)